MVILDGAACELGRSDPANIQTVCLGARQEERDLSMGPRTEGFPVKKLNASWHERRSAP